METATIDEAPDVADDQATVDQATAGHATADLDDPALAQRYVRNPSLKIMHCGEDELLVLHGSRSNFRRTIADEGRTKILSRVVRHLDTPTSLRELHEAGVIDADDLGTARELVDYLAEENVITPADEHPVALYLKTLHGEATPLENVSVGLVGAGYLGARIADELARLGIGRIVALDDRRVTDEDLDTRQFNLAPDALEAGKAYVDCVRDGLAAYGYDRVETLDASPADPDALGRLFAASHFVIVASEAFTSRLFHHADEAAIEHGRPWMSAFLDGSTAVVGPIYVPGDSCTYNEFEIQAEAALSISQADYYTYKEQLNNTGLEQRHFTLPAHLSTTSGLVASAVATFLGYSKSHLVGRCLRLNFEQPYVDYEEVLRLPRSPASASTRHGYRHTFM